MFVIQDRVFLLTAFNCSLSLVAANPMFTIFLNSRLSVAFPKPSWAKLLAFFAASLSNSAIWRVELVYNRKNMLGCFSFLLLVCYIKTGSCTISRILIQVKIKFRLFPLILDARWGSDFFVVVNFYTPLTKINNTIILKWYNNH